MGDKKVTFIETFPATFMINEDLTEVYSKLVWVTLGGVTPLTLAAPM